MKRTTLTIVLIAAASAAIPMALTESSAYNHLHDPTVMGVVQRSDPRAMTDEQLRSYNEARKLLGEPEHKR